MIDLSGNSTVKIDWGIDTDTNIVTLVFKQDDDTTVLGTLVVDGARFRSMIEALGDVGLDFLRDVASQQGHKTIFSNETDKSTTEFNP